MPVSKRILTGLLAGVLMTASGWLAADEAAQALVVDNTQAVLADLKENRDKVANDPGYIRELIEKRIVPHLDFGIMTALALGRKHWKAASGDQRKALVTQFRHLLLNTYSKSLAEYRDQRIEFLPFEASSKKGRAVVRSRFYPSGGQAVGVDYSLRDKNGWKIYDITIDGISLVKNFRSSFDGEIQQHGIDGLIKSLQDKNENLGS